MSLTKELRANMERFVRDADTFVGSSLLTTSEVTLIKDAVRVHLDQEGESSSLKATSAFAKANASLLKNVVSQPVLPLYLLTSVLDNSKEKDCVIAFYGNLGGKSSLPEHLAESLLRHVESSHDGHVASSSLILLSRLLRLAPSNLSDSCSAIYTSLLAFITDALSNRAKSKGTSKSRLFRESLRACTILLRNKFLRPHFVSHPLSCRILVELLSSKQGDTPELQQVLYDATFCIWAVSYDEVSLPALARANAVKHIIRASLTAKDKVVRVGLAVLRNLLGKHIGDDVNFNERMIDNDALSVLTEIAMRQWSNVDRDREDAMDDLKTLTVELQKNVRLLSSFDRYKIELQSGTLRRGFIHSERFWSENARKFEYKNFQLIKELVALLDSPQADGDTIAVACYDLGEFARFYESGRTVIVHAGGKEKLMKLVEHTNDEVKREALQASAKLLISNWEYVSSG